MRVHPEPELCTAAAAELLVCWCAEVQGHALVGGRQVRLPPSPVPRSPSATPHGNPADGGTPAISPALAPPLRQRPPSLAEFLRGQHELPATPRSPGGSPATSGGHARRPPTPLPSPLPPSLRCAATRTSMQAVTRDLGPSRGAVSCWVVVARVSWPLQGWRAAGQGPHVLPSTLKPEP